jgi:hypothetical protein
VADDGVFQGHIGIIGEFDAVPFGSVIPIAVNGAIDEGRMGGVFAIDAPFGTVIINGAVPEFGIRVISYACGSTMVGNCIIFNYATV